MKTLKQIAASFNLYQIEDIPATHRIERNDYRIESGKKDIPEFLRKRNSIEIGLFYECETQDANTDKVIYYIENSFVLVKGKGSENVLMLMKDKNKKFRFYPYYSIMRKYQGIAHHIKEAATKSLSEPNLIGVFTEKKVNDWITYQDQRIAALENCLKETGQANKDIEDKIGNFIKSLPKPEVQNYQNKTWITTSKFQVIFTHFKDQKYLNTEITFKGSLQDITAIENSFK